MITPEKIPAPALENAPVNLLDLSLTGLSELMLAWGEKSFRAKQLFQWIHKRGLTNFDDMTDLSQDFRAKLKLGTEIRGPEIANEQVSRDGTRKWLMRLEDGNNIETVFIPDHDRGTLCISSQVGCVLNCRFCSTATQGFNRNLKVFEIIGQIWQAARRLREVSQTTQKDEIVTLNRRGITNVVMMGMGEPLLNYDAVITALSIMRSDLAYALPKRRVTLSTAGFVPNIDRLAEDSDVSLAISLHAPNNELRSQLVPLNKKFPIEELIAACKRYAGHLANPVRFITIEYVMLKDVNDHLKEAKELIKVLKDLPCKINLIPFNPFMGSQFERSELQTILAFQAELMRAGFIATIRKTRGDDIDAACGQLRGKMMDKTKRNERWLKIRVKEDDTCNTNQACG